MREIDLFCVLLKMLFYTLNYCYVKNRHYCLR